MKHGELIPQLFRTEYRKIISVLYKHFGFDERETAEDIASETFLAASETWGLKGIPENPTAWLYNVAKNKALNYVDRNSRYQNNIAPVIKRNAAHELQHEDIDLSPENVNDSQLRMMFTLCHPSIPKEAQIGLSLQILCGLGIDEIANAFFTNRETIKKRLVRARESLREQAIKIEVPSSADLDARLDSVLSTVYLVFNEGYYSTHEDTIIRKELCLEAMRLCNMLTENAITNKPRVNALLALMSFHASRLEARVDNEGAMILYEDQEEARWNQDLIRQGEHFLDRAAFGDKLSKYHLEAGIAWLHTQKTDTREKWENILQLYNHLVSFEYSRIAALNRTYALARARSKQEALDEAKKLALENNHLYFALLGFLYTGMDDHEAKRNFERAIDLSKTTSEKRILIEKINRLKL